MTRPKSPMLTTVELLGELKKHPNGATSKQLEAALGRKTQAMLSKLYFYAVIDRVLGEPNFHNRIPFIYLSKLPRTQSPPAADVESSSVASQPAGVE